MRSKRNLITNELINVRNLNVKSKISLQNLGMLILLDWQCNSFNTSLTRVDL